MNKRPFLSTLFSLIFLLLVLYPTPIFAQSSLRSLILQTQTELDNFQNEQALQTIRRAEPLLAEDSTAATRLYCLMIQCLLKSPKKQGLALYQKKLKELPSSSALSDQADIQYLTAYLFHVSGDYDNALSSYQNAYDLYVKLPKPYHSNAIRAQGNAAAILLDEKSDPVAALLKCNIAQEIVETQFGKKHIFSSFIYHNKAMALLNQRRVSEASEYYRQALSIRNTIFGPEHPETLSTLIGYTVVQNAMGDYVSAEQNLMFALKPLMKNNSLNLLPKLYANLGVSNLMGMDFTEAIYYLKKGLEIEESQKDITQIVITLYNIGTAYRDQLKSDSALMYYEKALQMAPINHPNRFDILSGIGLTYERMGILEKAEEKYREAQTLNQGRVKSFTAVNNFNLGSIMASKGLLKDALESNRKVQKDIGYKGGDNYEGISDMLYLLEALFQECHILWEINAKNENMENLQNVRSACRNTITLFNKHEQSMHEAPSRQIVQEHLYPIVEIALMANQRIHDLTKDPAYWKESFDLVEQAKALRLYESLLKEAALNNTLPDSIRQQVYEKRTKISDALTDFQNKLYQGISEDESTSLRQSISIKKIEFDQYWRELEKEYPGISPEKNTLVTIGIDSLQRMLKPKQTFLEYFVGNSSLFLLKVQKDSFQIIGLLKDSLDWEVSAIRNAMESPLSDKFRKKYTETANKIYLKLIPKNPDYELIISPDGLLYLLPFEALLTSPLNEPLPKYDQYPFMIRENCISYTYSATILSVMSKGNGKRASKREVLGMAPFFEDNKVMFLEENTRGLVSQQDTFSGLINSGAELNAIKKYWPGEYYYKDNASIERYRLSAPEYSIIHLSTHGVSNNNKTDAAFITFAVPGKKATYNKMYSYNLANIPLAADLVTISACQSAMGKQQISEGVFSIARSCTQAGAKSVVTTLWSINDLASNKIIALFYHNLFLGENKDEALRKAKLEFMSDNSFRRLEAASPALWAAFIPIGNMNKIEK